ncbi:MAG: DUF2070 family protein [Candidatus Caldarchaeales archaeon]
MKNLKLRNHTTRLASLYPYIKGLPGKGSLVTITITSATITVFLVSLIAYPIILLSAVSFYSIILVNYIFSRNRRELVNFRRLNGITLIELSMASIGLATIYLAHILRFPIILALSILSSLVALATMLRGLIIRVLSGDSLTYTLKYSTTVSLLQVLPFLLSNLEDVKITMIIGQLVGSIAYIGYSSTIDVLLKIRGLKPLELLSAMLAIFLDGVRENLERLAEKLESKSDIKIELIAFREVSSRKVDIALIVPGFHPGPFKDFGSTILPYLIDEKLSRHNIRSVIVKGLSDHSKNIISRIDCEFISDEIERKILNHDSDYSSLLGSTKILNSGSVTTTLIPIGKTILTLVTLHPEGMEDIPLEVMDDIRNDELVVVDAHNSFSEDVRELNDRLEDVKRALKNASRVSVDRCSEIFLGYGETDIDGYGLEDGIGPLGIRTILLKNNDKFSALTVIDSNNAVPQVRDKILEEVKRIGIDYCEVLTTDTHIVNGVKLGGRGYHPLGEVIPIEEIVESVLRTVRKAKNNIKKMEAARISFIFNNIKVMSNDFLEEAADKTQKSLRLLFLTIFSTIVISGLLTFTILYLLF